MTTKKVSTKEATKDLFVDVNEREQLEMVGRDLYYKGEKLTDNQRDDLSSQAQVIKDLEVTEILLREMENVACKAMYKQGEDDLEALKFGKHILWTIDVLRKKIHNLSRLKK
jgi:DNA topoisomerase VI subunit A